ncbi:hybrid sensor histidine kinase/response regulator [Desulfobacterales bacterium HSG2]|nr:hybrid sensor histidine kinase/response regulator [Desulfobacterales bacterium HSG2]
MTDENIRIFIDESLEHLSDIENELLAIEQRGADIDENLVNKVYRAAHSIKGGAGFMGLANIKNLTHEMEHVLGKIRAREIVPNAPVINVLLLASDTLRNLINDIDNSDDADITEHIESLNSVTEGLDQKQYAEKELKAVTPVVNISFPGEKCIFSVPEEDISNIRKQGKSLYLIELDLIQLFEMKKETLFSIIDDMKRCGVILDSRPDIPTAENLDADKASDGFPFLALFATVLKSADVSQLLNSKITKIYIVSEDYAVKPAAKESAEEISGPETEDTPKEVSAEESVSPDIPLTAKATAEEMIAGPETEDATDRVKEVSADESVSSSIPLTAKAAAEEMIPGPETEDATDRAKAVSAEESVLIHADTQSGGSAVGSKTEPSAEPMKFQTSLRVNINLLDSLMTLAGELVLSRNQLIQAIIRKDRRTLEISGQRIDLITSELQEAIMHTRMQPIRNIFNKFPRVVRDLAMRLNKKIDLFIEGKEVELDKSIIESLNDPMIHLIRNAADHGIEPPESRIRQGKDPVGNIRLRAYHEAGQVNIEISDDGRGMDGEQIAGSAIAKGLASEELVRGMSPGEKVNLIFLPGFSTSDKITDLSGRGVGMDVVKTNFDRLGGLVDIDSEPGKGTTIHIKLPLTLAIIPSLLVSDGNERYAIPQVNVVELMRIPHSQIKERIEHVGNAQVVRLRDKLLPLMRLADILMPERSRADQKELGNCKLSLTNERRGVNIVVVSGGIFKYGMIVDELHDSEEIVVKPLGRHLKDCRGYAGATILGDGRVALILDVSDLARLSDLASISGSVRDTESAEKDTLPAEDQQTLLLFRNSEKTRFAVPLELVERIEKIRCGDIEIAGGRRVIQYRNSSMPLFDIGDVALVDKFEAKKYALVIVFFVAGMDVGILAIPPIDSMKAAYRADDTALIQPGISGSAVIDGKTTLMVDIIGIVEALHPEWFAVERRMKRQTGESKTIVLAEDSKLFRNQIKCAIEDAGYHVIEAEDGMVAWDLLQKNADQVSLVVTDLEMPNLDGFGFTRQIKEDKRFSHLPVIAVSSLAGKEDIKRAKASGVDEYQIKLDRKKLVECIDYYLGKESPSLRQAQGTAAVVR